MVSPRHSVIAIVGPTATGKSTLAEALAQQLNGEIVSADSMQVYRGMDIGTAKILPSEQSVPYHCLDLVDPGEEFNASRYQQAARAALDDIAAREKQPIMCGGTGLYVRAALDAFELGGVTGEGASVGAAVKRDASIAEAPVDETASVAQQNRRNQLEAQAYTLGTEAFYAQLVAVDPKSAALIHPNNVRRVVRAFEWLDEGSSYANQAAGFGLYHEVYPTVYLGLDMPRELLYARINKRVEDMIQDGLLEEVRSLLDEGYEQALTAQQAIGYKELLAVLSGQVELETAVTQIQQATRHYAKRQLSWFRRDKRIFWLDALLPCDELTAQALARVRESR